MAAAVRHFVSNRMLERPDANGRCLGQQTFVNLRSMAAARTFPPFDILARMTVVCGLRPRRSSPMVISGRSLLT